MQQIYNYFFSNSGDNQQPSGNDGSSSSTTEKTNSQRKICAFCEKEPPKPMTCGRCQLVRYCDPDCQKAHWKIHKLVCKPPEKTTLKIVNKDLEGNVKSAEQSFKLFDVQSLQQKNTKFNGPSSIKPEFFTGLNGPINHFNLDNIMAFLRQYAAKELDVSGYPGLKASNQVATFLKEENYRELLKLVWSEKDNDYKLAWLKKQANAGHVIFMFETARLLGKICNNNQKLILEAFHWRTLGRIHTYIDSACYNDDSVRDIANELQDIYQLEHLLKGFSEAKRIELAGIIFKQIEQIFKVEIKDTQPTPRWLQFYGMTCYLGINAIFPEGEWLSRRTARLEQMRADLKK